MRISDWSSDVCSSDLCTNHKITHVSKRVQAQFTHVQFTQAQFTHNIPWFNSLFAGISACRMPRPAVIHCRSPGPMVPTLPLTSSCCRPQAPAHAPTKSSEEHKYDIHSRIRH